MNMQDKELDALFSSKLDDLEIAPSRNLWGNITAELDADKRNRSLLPYLSVAASIIVVITAGILLWPQAAKVDTTKPADKTQVAVKQIPTVVKPVTTTKQEQIETPVVQSQPVVESIASAPIKKRKPVTVVKEQAPEAIMSEEESVLVAQEEPVLAATQQTPAVISPVVPDNNVPLSEKTISTEAEPFKTKPVVMAAVSVPVNNAQEAQPVKKKKINSFGGLLNALVSKIDKRKDKVIQFSDGDENHITGINLGIIKIKSNNDN